MDGKVNSESDFHENFNGIFVATAEQAVVKADPVVEVNGIRIWIQPLPADIYHLDHDMTLNDFLDLIGVLNDPSKQAIYTNPLTGAIYILNIFDGNMPLVDVLDHIGYDRNNLEQQFLGNAHRIQIIDTTTILQLQDDTNALFHPDVSEEIFYRTGVTDYQRSYFSKKVLDAFDIVKSRIQDTFRETIHESAYNIIKTKYSEDFGITQEEWLELVDSKAKDEHGAFTQEFEKIVDLCLKEQVFLNLIELSGAQDQDVDAIFSTLDAYLDENLGSLIEQLFNPSTFEAFISEVINQVLINVDNEGFVSFNVPTQEYFEQILDPEPLMLMHDGGILLPVLSQNLKMIKEHKGEINFLCDFIYRLENLFQEDILFEGLGDLPIPSDYVDKDDNNMIKNNFLKMQGPSETRPYSVVYLKQILKVLKLSISDLQKISWITTNPNEELEFNKIYEKTFYRTMLEHIQDNINDPLLRDFTIVQGLMFSSDEFKITDEDFYIIEIVDSVLNELFGHIGYSLLQMGLMTCGLDGNVKYKIDFKIHNQEHLYLLKEIIKDFGINSFVELDTLQLSDNDYVNLILGVLLTGYFKEIKIRNEAGNLIDIRRINTFPHSSFLEEVFQNYKYEDFNNERVYNLMFNDLFIENFLHNRFPVEFFRLSELYNDILFYRLPPNTKFTKAKTIGIVEESGGFSPIKDDQGNIIGWREENIDKIIWLELGNPDGGMEHILYPRLDIEGFPLGPDHPGGHFQEFYNWGYKTETEIAELILKTVRDNQYVRYDGGQVYKVSTNYGTMYLMVRISINGYIITAYPIYINKLPPAVFIEKLNEIEN